MHNFAEKLRSTIVFRMDSNGIPLLRRVKGSSIDLADIDEQETRRNVESLVLQLLSRYPLEAVLSELKDSVRFVKSSYTQTHDGFRVAKGTSRDRSITVSDVYAFSVAAGFCFDFLPPTSCRNDSRVGIGVMAPAIQDCGKNLIKLVWKAAGFEVVDLGNTTPPETWLKEISLQGLSLLGISCIDACLITRFNYLCNIRRNPI